MLKKLITFLKVFFTSDKKLLEYYKLGWTDNCNGKTEKRFDNPILQRAYIIGWLDFMAGDDVSSVDEQTNEQIIRHIRFGF
jgi:hypothetical protein